MLLLGLAAACAGVWLLEDEDRLAALAALFLAAAALTKNEGLPPALAMAATMLLVASVRTRRLALAPLLVLLAPLVALAPWRIWIHTHGVVPSTDYRFSTLLHPDALAHRLHRLSFAAHALPDHLFSRQEWLLALPLMLAATLLAAVRRPSLSLLAAVSVGSVLAALLVAYWIGVRPVRWYVLTSVDRVIASAIVMAVVFLPLLLDEASRGDRPQEDIASP